MKTFKELNEATTPATNVKVEPVAKGIWSEGMKKRDGNRKSKITFNILYSDNSLKSVTWKQYKASNLPSRASEHAEKGFVKALMATITQFNRKVDANGQMQRVNSFEEKIDILLKNGAKLTKRGLTVD